MVSGLGLGHSADIHKRDAAIVLCNDMGKCPLTVSVQNARDRTRISRKNQARSDSAWEKETDES